MSEQYSPAMQQYVDLKKQHEDKIIFFRLGDFYEFFFEDAKICAKILDLVLTKKKAGNGNLVDMAGVPHHSYKEYVKKLVEMGYKVAIVEQMENPNEVKGIVKRDVVEIITPATISLEQNAFESSYLCSITKDVITYSVYYFDIITNEVMYSNHDDLHNLFLELKTLNVKEVLLNFSSKEITNFCSDEKITKTKYRLKQPSDALNMGITYLKQILNIETNLFKKPQQYLNNDHILLSKSTLDNLEIFTQNVKNNLFNTINNLQTMMGSRLLYSILKRPYKNEDLIKNRLDQIKYFYDNTLQRMEILGRLKNIYDLDRLHTKMMLKKLSPRAILKIRDSLVDSFEIMEILNNSSFDTLKELITLINCSILKTEELTSSRFVNPSYDSNLNDIFKKADESKKWLLNYEQELKTKYDIKSLKIGFNKIFGYYIEVSKMQANLVPDFFIRKQTLVNNERFITEEMKEKETLILNSEEIYLEKQNQIYNDIINKMQDYEKTLAKLSKFIANLDLVCSNAQLAKQKKLVCPVFSSKTKVEQSRHLTIENIIGTSHFVANDYDFCDNNIIILTGPNMSGKSTYMRQIAITQIMAQSGLFVSAKKATLEIVDQIFTRIGAGDDLSSGKSTFLVEMEETSNALNNATNDSLIILDELGRGTSTYDGLSIAFGVLKYINDNLKAKTILATHYHELTTLQNILTNCKNMTIEVIEKDQQVIFKHKIINGRAKKSYGIHVAKIANINSEVLNNAQIYLNKLEKNKTLKLEEDEFKQKIVQNVSKTEQLISNLDLNNLTPLEALNILNKLKGDLTNAKS